MCVYNHSDRKPYTELSSFRQGWLDYWLYLHGDESSPCLAARPISPWSLAKSLLSASPTVDRAFLRASQAIVSKLVRSSISTIPSASIVSILQEKDKEEKKDGKGKKEKIELLIHPAWLKWATDVSSTNPDSYREELVQMLVSAESANDFAK